MSVRRGDQVVVLTGKDKGKRGEITRVFPEKNRVIVDGVNMVKRHLRRQPGSLQAGIIDKPAPLARSNVMLICPNCNMPSRGGRTVLADGTHARVCKKCGEIIDKGQ
ncbi:MAG TPA: 50S ribosomal protein L24 [Chloroflexota bacterium]|nr:50S ribosomal protein L24 [Chloroflexota bacterium]